MMIGLLLVCCLWRQKMVASKRFDLASMVALGSRAPIDAIEILGLEGESTNEEWTIFLGYQGEFISVLTSAVRLGCLRQKKYFVIV
jgi:hypothetical protein